MERAVVPRDDLLELSRLVHQTHKHRLDAPRLLPCVRFVRRIREPRAPAQTCREPHTQRLGKFQISADLRERRLIEQLCRCRIARLEDAPTLEACGHGSERIDQTRHTHAHLQAGHARREETSLA